MLIRKFSFGIGWNREWGNTLCSLDNNLKHDEARDKNIEWFTIYEFQLTSSNLQVPIYKKLISPYSN